MRHLSIGVIAAASAIAFTQSVFAADLPVKAAPAPVAIAPSWTGFYIGLNAGYGWGDYPISLVGVGTNLVSGGGFPASFNLSPSGFVGGAQLGYNYQVGKFVFGVEGEFDYAHITDSTDIVGFLGVPRFTHADVTLDWFATIRGRVGYTPIDPLLIYLTGGFAAGRVKSNLTGTTTTPNNVPACIAASTGLCFGDSTSKDLTGWTIGGGLEYALGGNWSTKVEYLYYDLGHINETIVDARGAPPFPTLLVDTHVHGNIVRAGLNYKFH